jgi:hypothetical protein
MLTVFEKIPDLFVQHYDVSFQTWAREFRKRGPKVRDTVRPGAGGSGDFGCGGAAGVEGGVAGCGG